MCNYLTARCLFESNEFTDALDVLQLPKVETFLQDCSLSNSNVIPDAELFDATPKQVRRNLDLVLD